MQYQKQLSEEKPKFMRLFGKYFKFLKINAMTRMKNRIKHYTFFQAFYPLPS